MYKCNIVMVVVTIRKYDRGGSLVGCITLITSRTFSFIIYYVDADKF